MQQSYNYEQLQLCITDKRDKLWQLAFEGQRPLSEFTERRFVLRYEYNAHFLEYWVRLFCSVALAGTVLKKQLPIF